MYIITIIAFVKYCTIINIVALLISTIMNRANLDYNIHTQMVD